MSDNKMAQIKGITVSETLMIKALDAVPPQGFSKTEFGDALFHQGLPAGHDGDFVRRVMQHLKQAGWIDFDGTAQSWHLTAFGQLRLPQKTLPLLPLDPGAAPQKPTLRRLPLQIDRPLVRRGDVLFECLGLRRLDCGFGDVERQFRVGTRA